MKILLTEDDISLQKGIMFKLNKEGYETVCRDTVKEALCAVAENSFDMAVLDINLPDGSGLDICREMRRRSMLTHILFLTARDNETDIVMGYDVGADDYLTKPFSLSVLLGKCGAVARRLSPGEFLSREIQINAAMQSACVRGETKELTRNEIRLLDIFIKNAGIILGKERLLQVLWDTDGNFVDENTLAVNIRRLREKIEKDPSKPELIETVRGAGYRFKG